MKKLIFGIWLVFFIAALNFGLSFPALYQGATVFIEDCQNGSDICENKGSLDLSVTGIYRMQLNPLTHLEMHKDDLINVDDNKFTFKTAWVRSGPFVVHN